MPATPTPVEAAPRSVHPATAPRASAPGASAPPTALPPDVPPPAVPPLPAAPPGAAYPFSAPPAATPCASSPPASAPLNGDDAAETHHTATAVAAPSLPTIAAVANAVVSGAGCATVGGGDGREDGDGRHDLLVRASFRELLDKEDAQEPLPPADLEAGDDDDSDWDARSLPDKEVQYDLCVEDGLEEKDLEASIFAVDTSSGFHMRSDGGRVAAAV